MKILLLILIVIEIIALVLNVALILDIVCTNFIIKKSNKKHNERYAYMLAQQYAEANGLEIVDKRGRK